MNGMKTRILRPLAVAGLVLGMSMGVHAVNAKNAQDWTCQDFLAVGDEVKPRVVYWMEGFNKAGKPEFIDVGIEDFSRPIIAVVEECKKEPKASLSEKIKKFFSNL